MRNPVLPFGSKFPIDTIVLMIAELCFISSYPLKGPGTDIITMISKFFKDVLHNVL